MFMQDIVQEMLTQVAFGDNSRHPSQCGEASRSDQRVTEILLNNANRALLSFLFLNAAESAIFSGNCDKEEANQLTENSKKHICGCGVDQQGEHHDSGYVNEDFVTNFGMFNIGVASD